jgi:hypothetical protein
MRLGRQSHNASDQFVQESLEGFAEAHGKEGLLGFGFEEERVGIDPGWQKVQLS